MTDVHPLVKGRCPACRGASLFLGSGGYVTCSRLDCPNPTAADDLLHGEQPAPEPCDGRPCTGTGCSHELAAAALTTHDYVLTFDHPPTPAERQQIADTLAQHQPKEQS